MQTVQQNEVVSFSNDQLRQGKYDFYTMRDLEYCRMQYKGMKALRGDMVGIYNQGHELFAVVEYFIQQGKCCVQEMICKERMDSDAINLLNAYVNGKGLLPKDVIDVLSSTFSSHNMERTKMLYMMARILDVERFIELVPLKVWRQAFPHVPEDMGLTLIISDNLFMKNVRMYSVIPRENDVIIGLSVSELEEAVFPYIRTFLNNTI